MGGGGGNAIEEVQGHTGEHESVTRTWRTCRTAGMFQSCRGDTNKHNRDHMTPLPLPLPPAKQLCSTRLWWDILKLALTDDSTHQSNLSTVRIEELWSNFTLPPGLRPAGENERMRE